MTDELIRIMARDCIATGDYLQAAICRLALGEPWHDLPLSQADETHASGLDADTAREMAEDVLEDVSLACDSELDEQTLELFLES